MLPPGKPPRQEGDLVRIQPPGPLATLRLRGEELIQRDKVSLDQFWLKNDSLEDSANLQDPDVIAAEIIEDLRAALEEFELIQGDLSS